MDGVVDYKLKYRDMKKKLKLLIYEQECFLEELKTSQKKLLKLNRDRSFLLDELLQYETKINDSSDSEATDSSNSDIGEVKEPKKAKISNFSHKASHGMKLIKNQKRRLNTSKAEAASGSSSGKVTSKAAATKQESQVTREEVERQLEMKQMSQPDFMNINVSYHPPEDIFNHDSSNQDCSEPAMLVQNEDDSELIIDMA